MSSVPRIVPQPEQGSIREVIEAWWESNPEEDRIAVADWIVATTGRTIGDIFDADDSLWFYDRLLEVMPEEDACSVFEGLEAGP